MKWVLIRHGKTQGNLEHRYIGSQTDESLCPQGISELKEMHYPPVQRVFVSPMKRCLETAALLYPGIPAEIVNGIVTARDGHSVDSEFRMGAQIALEKAIAENS